MGNHNQLLIKKIKSALGNDLFKKSSGYLFGSQVSGTFNRSSDFDILILTQLVLSEDKKNEIINVLLKNNIQAHVMSTKTMNEDRNHTFIEGSPFESASRYAEHLYGRHQFFSTMSDNDLLLGMLSIALFRINHINKFLQTDGITKELFRATLVVWCLERRLELQNIYSIGHFIHWLMASKDDSLVRDKLWNQLEKSSLMWGWLDEEMAYKFGRAELIEWAQEVKSRLAPFASMVKSLNFGDISEEIYRFQLNDVRFQGVKWEKRPNQKITMADGGIQHIINLIKSP